MAILHHLPGTAFVGRGIEELFWSLSLHPKLAEGCYQFEILNLNP